MSQTGPRCCSCILHSHVCQAERTQSIATEHGTHLLKQQKLANGVIHATQILQLAVVKIPLSDIHHLSVQSSVQPAPQPYILFNPPVAPCSINDRTTVCKPRCSCNSVKLNKPIDRTRNRRADQRAARNKSSRAVNNNQAQDPVLAIFLTARAKQQLLVWSHHIELVSDKRHPTITTHPSGLVG